MTPASADDGAIAVEVAFAPAARQVDLVRLRVSPGMPLREAVAASGLAARHPAVAQWLEEPPQSLLTVAVWGRRAEPGQPLRERDRVELLRPLTVDPKEARRQRYRRTVSGSPSR
jgi:putative ubiquitin-RnfH superfamily antitoxin RatB of RatAB toxin-antitoxin module